MDASPHSLAENVRARRASIDNDLELLRTRLENADPRHIDPAGWTSRVALPLAVGAAAAWVWRRQRRRVGSLQQLLVHCLIDLYKSEHEALPALDRMAAQSHDQELKKAFLQHRYETEGHIERLERVFRSVGARPPRRRSSPTVAAIVSDGERLLSRKVNRHVRDAWLIAIGQRVEHLEMAGYGTARTYAEMLGYTVVAQLLEHTLEEERATDERLTILAERFVNPESVRRPGSAQRTL
jgi:ferritin-like metal-binding protein YciE